MVNWIRILLFVSMLHYGLVTIASSQNTGALSPPAAENSRKDKETTASLPKNEQAPSGQIGGPVAQPSVKTTTATKVTSTPSTTESTTKQDKCVDFLPLLPINGVWTFEGEIGTRNPSTGSSQNFSAPSPCPELRTGFVNHSDECDPQAHRKFWKFFWMNPNTNETVELIQNGTMVKDEACNELEYQTCNGTCSCDEGAIFNTTTSSCELVDTAYGCGPLIPERFQQEDGRRCAFEGMKRNCDSRAKCMPICLETDSFEPTSICNVPTSIEPKEACNLINDYYKQAEKLPWLKRGQECKIIENFGPEHMTHDKQKLTVMENLDHFILHAKTMCDPFKHLECHQSRRICTCGKHFIEHEGRCYLTVVKDTSDSEEVGQKLCEWSPDVIYLGKTKRSRSSVTDVMKKVSCEPDKATCKPNPDDDQRKICLCDADSCADTGKDSLTSKGTQCSLHQMLKITIVAIMLALLNIC